MNACCNTQEMTQEDVDKWLFLQAKLDHLYFYRQIQRSHAKWLEDGEKNTAYFCQIQKRRQKSNAVHSLIFNYEVITDPKLISEEIYSFYSDIYKILSHILILNLKKVVM